MRLNRKVVITGEPTGQDAAGGPSGARVAVCTVMGDVRFLSGSETIRGDAPVSSAKASIRIRYRTDITAAMQAACDGQTFQIQAVLPDMKGRKFTDLACQVVT